MGHRLTRQGPKYVVRWLDYGPEEDSLLREEDLANARDVLEAYKAYHSL